MPLKVFCRFAQKYFMTKQTYPEPTVGALILNQENKLFLMKSHKWGNRYCIPGGHVEIGETIEEALIREVKEETNLNIYDIKYVCFFEVIFDPHFINRKHFIFFDFVCKTRDTEVVLNDEAEDYLWIDLNEVNTLNLEENTKRFIEMVMMDKSLFH